MLPSPSSPARAQSWPSPHPSWPEPNFQAHTPAPSNAKQLYCLPQNDGVISFWFGSLRVQVPALRMSRSNHTHTHKTWQGVHRTAPCACVKWFPRGPHVSKQIGGNLPPFLVVEALQPCLGQNAANFLPKVCANEVLANFQCPNSAPRRHGNCQK